MKRIIIFVVVILFSGITSISGQEKEIVLSKNSIASLTNGIHSENDGLKKSSMQMVSRYKLKQVCPILIAQFANESEMDYKMLIAEIVYDVGCSEAIETFRTVLKDETINELKYFCKMLHENYMFARN